MEETTKLSREGLLERLQGLAKAGYEGDPENAHLEADNLLLDYINDSEITGAFKSVPRWYA